MTDPSWLSTARREGRVTETAVRPGFLADVETRAVVLPQNLHRLVIPGWIPHRLNELLGNPWRAGRRKKSDRDMVAIYARMQGIPKATGKRRVSLEITLTPRCRGKDPDSFWKSLCDALTACGLIRDDSAAFCELVSPTFARGPTKGVVVTLENLE